MIGLVGHSGSGKSTLVNLICRFYDVSEGPSRSMASTCAASPCPDYRRHIGLVLQEPFLFFGTIAENIAYGKPDATRDEIIVRRTRSPCARIHPAPAARLRLAGGRARPGPVGRRAPAHQHCPGAADRIRAS